MSKYEEVWKYRVMGKYGGGGGGWGEGCGSRQCRLRCTTTSLTISTMTSPTILTTTSPINSPSSSTSNGLHTTRVDNTGGLMDGPCELDDS